MLRLLCCWDRLIDTDVLNLSSHLLPHFSSPVFSCYCCTVGRNHWLQWASEILRWLGGSRFLRVCLLGSWDRYTSKSSRKIFWRSHAKGRSSHNHWWENMKIIFSGIINKQPNNYLEEEPVSFETLGLNSFVTEKEQHFQGQNLKQCVILKQEDFWRRETERGIDSQLGGR